MESDKTLQTATLRNNTNIFTNERIRLHTYFLVGTMKNTELMYI